MKDIVDERLEKVHELFSQHNELFLSPSANYYSLLFRACMEYDFHHNENNIVSYVSTGDFEMFASEMRSSKIVHSKNSAKVYLTCLQLFNRAKAQVELERMGYFYHFARPGTDWYQSLYFDKQ